MTPYEDAWNRWLQTGAYARQHTNGRFMERFTRYIAAIWNLAHAQGQFLQHFYKYAGETQDLHDFFAPPGHPRITFWKEAFLKETSRMLLEVVEAQDITPELAGFLFGEYSRLLEETARPLGLRERASRVLPHPYTQVPAIDAEDADYTEEGD